MTDTTQTTQTDIGTNDRDESYEAFILAKVAEAPAVGFEPPLPLSESLFPHQRDIVRWACLRGRAAIFASFGLGKTRMQLEVARQTVAHALLSVGEHDTQGAAFLIVAPLAMRREFRRDAEAMGLTITFARTDADVDALRAEGVTIILTNYESVREGKINPARFAGVSLDEAAILRGFGGTKTFREAMATMAGDDRRDMSARVVTEGVRYRFVATATPSPNEFIELLAYSAFLGVMDVSTAKTRFFKRDSEKADSLTLHPQHEAEFWRWVASWAVFVTRPSDIDPTYSDEGYTLPELDVRWHEIPTHHLERAGEEKAKPGKAAQLRMFADAAKGVSDASREARESLDDRIAKLVEIRAAAPTTHRVIWHDLEAEREAIEAACEGVATVYGSQPLDEREGIIERFSDGEIAELAAKPVMLGSGCNFQRHCAEAVFLSVGYKFNDFIQAIHRLARFGQPHRVKVHVIYTEAQREIRRALEAKWSTHRELVDQMTTIVRERGLGDIHHGEAPASKTVYTREEASGASWRFIHTDTVDETRAMQHDTVDLIATSIPFSSQYKYSDNYRDFGHSDTNDHFFQQMGFLSPELFRVLKPGRIFACHVKDRVVPGGLNGLGFQTIYPFHAACIDHYTRAGFAYMGMITVVTDVVRENSQTNRLGWSEVCKDGTKMSCGLPEYILLFRKPPTSQESARADDPVVHEKAAYTRGRWQIDAHAFWRSSGNRLLSPADLVGNDVDAAAIFQRFGAWSSLEVYDYSHHVALCEALDAAGKLPPSFMLLQPQSRNHDVWSDVARMRTMNTLQAAQERVQHLCPMQFDIADRLIERFSNPGEVVYDPFGGLGTVPLRAMKLRRKGIGTELNPVYYREAVRYLRAEERAMATPTLFDLDAVARVVDAAPGESPLLADRPGPVEAKPARRAKKENAA